MTTTASQSTDVTVVSNEVFLRVRRRRHAEWMVFLLTLMVAMAACEDTGANRTTKSTPNPKNPMDAGTDTDTDADSDGDGDSDSDSDSIVDTESENPCNVPDPPEALCMLIPSGPACGDGSLDVEEDEACDDGNTVPGDGCTGRCVVEKYWECPNPGEPCDFLLVCGNGEKETGEVCDDGNTNDDDGCNSTCDHQSASYICPEEGEPCERVVFCGDGRILGDETCEDDDGQDDLEAGDGCDENCNTEEGWTCPLPGEPCRLADRCGDEKLTPGIGEMCDDGNLDDGDGCTSDCQIESGWNCPTPGDPCIDLNSCNDGKVTGNEACDDANEDPDDGCDECRIAEGYACPFPGALCIPLCGDGILLLNEICDDGNTDDDDGCSSTCEWEEGFACEGPAGNYDCHKTTCGDKKAEGTEACDDGNNNMGDGCTPFCDLEPVCSGGACTSICGDGLLLDSVGEKCDDGNNKDGDGCSSSCQVESGYECTQPALGDTMTVPIVVRDFPDDHPDFENGVTGSEVASEDIVEDELDSDGKPVYAGTDGDGYISSNDSFSEWFRDTSENATIVLELTLYDNDEGGYVNRWGDDGEQWPYYSEAEWCGAGGSACGECAEGDYDVCLDPCTYWGEGNTDACGVMVDYQDGDPVFFPLDGQSGALTPPSPTSIAKIPPPYSESWPDEPGGGTHNFSFTSEVRYWFEYNDGETYSLDFMGDDDVWVFINNQLAVDLGGIHTPVSGSITLTDANADDFGLEDGQVYEIVVFQAERQTNASSYKLTLSGFNAAKSKCGPICGDGVLSPGEQCDNGDEENTGGYGQCNEDCTLGEYCGDGDVNGSEECDDGVNISAYNSAGGGCAPNCIMPPQCGDSILQPEFSEECDEGEDNDGSYEGCTEDCKRGPFCGDGIPNEPEEECDDGANDGTYNTCAPECVLGPRCGDSETQTEFGETCDDGNNEAGDGCSPNCVEEGICGDSIVQEGEECDDGVNDGGYGDCAPDCTLAEYCGDGVVQDDINPETDEPYEQCDDGSERGGTENNYGGCAPGCVLGPHCGDAVLQPTYEECDDGNDDEHDKCTSACKDIVMVPI